MNLLGRWRIVEMPDYVDSYRNMVEPGYILFGPNGSGEFASAASPVDVRRGRGNYVAFSCQGNDGMDKRPRQD
ncbi:hypothetical protein [Mesorhizobium sp. BHbdii]